MNYYELRELLESYPKYQSATKVVKAPIINDAYPGQFNLSFTESLWLKEFGNYLDFEHDYIFSLIQPVIRYNDFKNNILAGSAFYRYLTLFEMSDLIGCASFIDADQSSKFTKFSIKEFLKFITNLDVPPDNLFVSCFAGSSVAEATNGKYIFDQYIPPFKLAIDEWVKAGIPKTNIILNKTRDTFLALNVFDRPTPWGYRNEIYIKNKNGELIDVGTLEHLIWRPVYKDSKIIGVQDYEHFHGINLVGIERLCMVLNNYDSIYECEHIKPLVDIIQTEARNSNLYSSIVSVECIRSTHRIVSDIEGIEDLSKNRKTKFHDFMEALYVHLDRLGITDKTTVVKKVLDRNSDLNRYYPELAMSVEPSTNVINAYFTKRFGTN